MDDVYLTEAAERYKQFQKYVEDATKRYLVNMADQLGVNLGCRSLTATKAWSDRINDGDDLATKAWCFVIEYIPNMMELGKNKSLSHLIVQGFTKEHGVDKDTKTCHKTKKNINLFSNLTDAYSHVFKAIRKKWRRDLHGGSDQERESRRYVTVSLKKEILKNLGQRRRKEDQFLLTDNSNGKHQITIVSSRFIDISKF